MTYLDAAHTLYRDAAKSVQKSLCCTPGPRFQLPRLTVPTAMEEMNYGCGTTVHLQDLSPGLDVLYIGVGSGLEALQFAYFTRRPRSVIVMRAPSIVTVPPLFLPTMLIAPLCFLSRRRAPCSSRTTP